MSLPQQLCIVACIFLSLCTYASQQPPATQTTSQSTSMSTRNRFLLGTAGTLVTGGVVFVGGKIFIRKARTALNTLQESFTRQITDMKNFVVGISPASNNRIGQMGKEIATRHDKIDATLEEHKSQLAQIIATCGTIDTRTGKIELNVEKMLQDLGAIEQRQERLLEGQKKLDESMRRMKARNGWHHIYTSVKLDNMAKQQKRQLTALSNKSDKILGELEARNTVIPPRPGKSIRST